MQRKIRNTRAKGWARRKKRVRKNIVGTTDRPRLNVFRSNKHIYAQIINDGDGQTLAAASSRSPELRDELSGLEKIAGAKKVGELAAKKCIEKKIDKVVFDRNGYIYHGRVQAVAEGAREAGLSF